MTCIYIICLACAPVKCIPSSTTRVNLLCSSTQRNSPSKPFLFRLDFGFLFIFSYSVIAKVNNNWLVDFG